MANQQITQYQNDVKELTENEGLVLSRLFNLNLGGKAIITPGELTIQRNRGNPSARHYLSRSEIQDGGEKRAYAFAARHFGSVSEKYQAEVHPAQIQADAYNFLLNAGIESVPRAVHLDKLPQWTFSEFLEGETLREVLNRHTNFTNLLDTHSPQIDTFLEALVDFQHKATNAAAVLPEIDAQRLFWSRDVSVQALDYIRTVTKKDEEQTREIVDKIYIPLFGNALRGSVVCHGDLSPDNIIFNCGKFNFIDTELKKRNPFADLGCLISYLGDYEKYWISTAENFGLLRIKHDLDAEGIELTASAGEYKGRILKRLIDSDKVETTASVQFGEDGRRKACFEFFCNILHYSLRNCAKITEFVGDAVKLEAARNNIHYVLQEFVVHPDSFGLNKDIQVRVQELRDFLGFNTTKEISSISLADTVEMPVVTQTVC